MYDVHEKKKNLSSILMVRLVDVILKSVILGDSMSEKMKGTEKKKKKKKKKEESS